MASLARQTPAISSGDAKVPSLRPFFGFYGGKWRDALKNYPAPEHRTVVEPFAGSAGYSVRHSHLDIVLCEIDPVIAGMWDYLIHASADEIRRLPDLPPDGSVEDLRVCEEARSLIGFWLNRAASGPRKRPSKWMRSGIRPGSFWGERVRETIAQQVDYIRHWRVYNVSYGDCPINGPATWFIDPPYQRAGVHYRFGPKGIDFDSLAAWCQERKGQVIVCENAGADWLPFETIGDVKTTRAGQQSSEVAWLNA